MAGTTAAVVALDTSGAPTRAIAMQRIELTCYGLVFVVLAANILFPRHAKRLARTQVRAGISKP